MTPEEWEEVGRVFDAAAALRPEERASFLDQACGENEALRREVQALLETEDRAGDFLGGAALEDVAKVLAKDEPPSLVGKRLGHYELRSLIGTGGMGEVYSAHDVALKREVAVKVLPSSFSQNADRLRRFKQEARAASALNHPNIVTIHEIGEIDSCHFIVSEYIEGETLRQRLTRGRMDFAEVKDVATQIAAGLAAAHTVGVVHRDIKPENVMLRPDGYVKILDFGLAKLSERADLLSAAGPQLKTDTGIVMGTSRYMSPEQARGLGVDARTDVWSLGVVLYEMLTGRVPFEGQTNSDVIASILEREPTALATLASTAPSELQRIAAKALRKDREERYQTIKDMLLDLNSVKEQLNAERLSGKIRRHKTALALILVALVIGAAVVIYLARLANQRREANRQPPPQRFLSRLTFDAGLQTEATWSPDGRFIAYSSDKSGNFDIWVQPVGGGNSVQVTKSPAHDWQPDWSPDGSQIVFRSEREGGGLFMVPALGGREHKISSFGYHPHWSPDGTKILFSNLINLQVSPAKVYVVTLEGNAPREVQAELLADFASLFSVAWHPDGQRISLFGERRNQGFGFWTVPLAGGTPVKSELDAKIDSQLIHDSFGPFNIRWAPSGRAIYFELILQGVGNLWKVTVDPQTLRWLAGPERLTTGSLDTDIAPSPDGKRLALTVRNESTRAWSLPFDARTGKVKGEGKPVTTVGRLPEFLNLSRDGKHLLYVTGFPGTQKGELWEKSLADNRETLLTVVDSGTIASPCWSRNGARIGYLRGRSTSSWDGSIAVQPAGGGDEQVIASGAGDLIGDWSADGQWILASTDRQSPGQWRELALYPLSAAPHAESQMRVLTSHVEYGLFQARFSPDDRWVCFNAVKAADESIIYVVPSSGGEWRRISEDNGWSDKPHWSADGKTIFYLSNRVTGFYNVWGIRFDPEQGKPVGQPFQVTSFDSPGRLVWPNLGGAEITLSADRLVLPVEEMTGSIWVLDGVDR
jgi:serine/threonine protein kinase